MFRFLCVLVLSLSLQAIPNRFFTNIPAIVGYLCFKKAGLGANCITTQGAKRMGDLYNGYLDRADDVACFIPDVGDVVTQSGQTMAVDDVARLSLGITQELFPDVSKKDRNAISALAMFRVLEDS